MVSDMSPVPVHSVNRDEITKELSAVKNIIYSESWYLKLADNWAKNNSATQIMLYNVRLKWPDEMFQKINCGFALDQRSTVNFLTAVACSEFYDPAFRMYW